MLINLLLVGVFVAGLSGIYLPRLRKLMPHDGTLRALTACGLGLAGCSFGMFGLGLLGLYQAVVFWPLVILLILFSARPWWVWFQDIRSESSERSGAWTRFELVLTAILAVAALTHLLYNYTPPTGEDELIYHITLPSRFIHAGGLVDVPTNFNSYFPLNAELIYTVLLLLGNVFTVKVMVFWTGILMSAALYYFSRRILNFTRRDALLATALCYTLPCITSLNGTTSSDQLNLFFEILSITLLWRWKDQGPRSLFWIAAILAGAGMGTRPYALGWIVAATLFLALVEKRPLDALLFGCIAGVLSAPWPLRSLWLTGNPFYPYAMWAGAAQDVYFHGEASSYGPQGWKPLLMLPFFLANGSLIWGIGPFPIAFAPLSWLDKRPMIRQLLIYTLILMVITALIPLALVNPRYFSQSYPWLCMLAVAGWTVLENSAGPFMKRACTLWILGILVCPGLILSLYFGGKRVPFILGRQSQAEYLERVYQAEGYAMMAYIHRTIPRSTLILNVGAISDASYFYYPEYRLHPMNVYPPRFYDQNGQDLARALKKDGYRYLLLNLHDYRQNPDGSYYCVYAPSLQLRLPALPETLFRKAFESPQSVIFEIS